MTNSLSKEPKENKKRLSVANIIIISILACGIGYGIYLIVLCFGSAWVSIGWWGVIAILGSAVIFYLLLNWFNR